MAPSDSSSATSVVASGASTTASSTPGAAAQLNKWGMLKGFAFRLLITYFVFSLFRRQPAQPPAGAPGIPSAPRAIPSTNMFPRGTPIELFAYLSEQSYFDAFNDSERLFWHQPGLVYGDWNSGPHGDGSFTKQSVIDCKHFQGLMKNGSLYLHVYVVKKGFSPNPSDEKRYSAKDTVYRSKMLTRYKRRRLSRTVNLLTGQTDTHPDLIANASTPTNLTYLPPVTHWHPNLTINLVDDHTVWIPGSVPFPLDQYVDFYPPTNEYYPVIFLNDYWNMNEDYKPVNETTPTLPISLTFAPLSMFKWQLYAAQASRKNWFSNILGDINLGGETEDEEEQDTLKKALVETNPYLLAITVVVSILHSVFELLAFKNDIQFWNSRESLEGLSVRSVFFNVFQSLIVFLYVLDNNTNMLITISVLLGLGIEIWKIKKVLLIQIDSSTRVLGIFPRVQVSYQTSYVETETKKFDQMAFRYLSWVLFPMLAMYCGYSLLYQEHRGWYSWVLSMLYGFLLTFGFIMMTPQLFINYKLKSVAHLPWRMLTYKALNTFIDDLFAFVIHMPTLYRIGCLRDDVIFFIFLYQRWIYPMDPNRVNEFGVSKEMLEKQAKPESKTNELEATSTLSLTGVDESRAEEGETSSSNKSDKEKRDSNVRRRPKVTSSSTD
ncbi:Cleft lip and palate associated transmembrane protein 1 [Fasciola gigantica]|uniref:Cleft lip and palate associated transmembrane protein 1 n=1 Tax=Fasciola gigantica TaxID=46835 RepID=A0A504YAC8_FASGI|nr:Cleft lip and palate associated transmembrane protein 1 [Fasciola gigantica]